MPRVSPCLKLTAAELEPAAMGASVVTFTAVVVKSSANGASVTLTAAALEPAADGDALVSVRGVSSMLVQNVDWD